VNFQKLKLMTVILVCIALLLGVLCVILDRFPTLGSPTESESASNPSSGQQTSPSVPPQTPAQTTTGTDPQETTRATTQPTTQETTAPTTEPTTVPTTVLETIVTVPRNVGYDAAMLAVEQIGKPYRYGGEGPDDFDASGLLQYCYMKQGVSVPRSTAGQADFGYEVAKEEILPGDAVFFWSTNPGQPEYVGIYVGNSVVVAALNSSKPVVEFNMETKYYTEHFVCARRFY